MTRIPARTHRPAMTTPFLVALLAGCLDAPPASDVQTPAAVDASGGPSIAPARYTTHFVFAGLDGTALFASFEQEATENSLERLYDAWWSGPDGWEPLISLRDTLPVPRAAWRILPSDGLNVHVGDAREVVGLDFMRDSRRFALRAGDEISVWTGPTGQRESVGMAGLTVDEDVVGGLLFFRRAARSLQVPPSEETVRGFVLADSVGNGLLIEVSQSDSSVVAGALPRSSKKSTRGCSRSLCSSMPIWTEGRDRVLRR